MDDELLGILVEEPNGIDVNALAGRLAASPQDAQNALNSLLASHRVELVKFGDSLRVKQKQEEAVGLSNEERVLHAIVEDAGAKGIWIRNLRDQSGLSQLQIRKSLKTLEQKKLIKAVKGVNTTKKCYMPYDAKEDESLTGGTFYSERQLDSELVHTLTSVCVGMLAQKRKMAVERNPEDSLAQKAASYATANEMADYVRNKKILHVPVSDEDIERILEVAIPCALCPLANECSPGKEINPTDCQYFNDWLANSS